MKLLLFIDTIGYHGGAERQLAGLASMLKLKGYDVSVLTYYPDPGYRDTLQNEGISVYMENFGSNPISKVFKSKKFIDSFSPDIIISFKTGPNIISCCLKLLGAKWKLIVSDRNTTQQLDLRGRIQYWFYNQANAIVPNSFSQSKFIQEHFPKLGSKLHVITNFTDCSRFSLRHSCEKVNDVIKFIGVGRITGQKNLIRFIRAIERVYKISMTKFHIDWYGIYSDPAYYEECLKEIDSTSVKDVFSFKGASECIENIYPQYDCLILPSVYEGFPNVLCEGMACGLPALVSDVCDNPNIVNNGVEGWLMNPYHVDDMADKILNVLDIPKDTLQEMGIAAHNKIANLCSEESFVNKYIKVIENL